LAITNYHLLNMKTLLRLFKLWRLYAWLDLMWVTRSFRQFVMYYLGDAVLSIAAITSTLLLAERFDGIGAWTKWQVVFMLGYAATVTGLLEMFFGYNVLYISRRLGRGQFDHTLIQPQPVWMALLTDGFNPFGASGTLISGLALIVWATMNLAVGLSPAWITWLVLNLSASSVVMLSFNFLWGSLAFWAPRAAEEINTPLVRMFDHLKSFPLDGLGGVMLGGLLSVAPVGFVAWYPCRYLLGLDATAYAGFVTPLAALSVGVLAAWVFTSGMRHYARVGSQRYRAMGHRG
jgi:viologen exporter family transport system permease protein